VRVSHYGFGWGVFAAALIVFFWLVTRFVPAADPAVIPAAPGLARASNLRAEVLACASAVAILVALPVVSATVRLAHPVPTDPGATQLVQARAPWPATPLDPGSSWLPVFAGADHLQRYSFANIAGETVEVLAVTYRTQSQGAELVGESSSVIGDELQIRAEQLVGDAATAYREVEVADRAGRRSLIWWHYDVAGRTLVNPFGQQLWYGINAIVWNPSSALIALRTACSVECDSARRTLRAFVADNNIR
jgi:hypothetical protein